MTALIKDHAPLAKSIAVWFKSRLPHYIPMDEIHAAAMFGLWDAVRRRPDCENFRVYASVRIQGAIRDDLRSKDWLSRSARKRAGNGPTQVIVDSDHPSIDATESGYDIVNRVSAARTLAKLVELVDLLPERDRRIFVSAYFEGASFRSIAAELGISEPRVSQLHARTMSGIRDALAGELDI